MKTKKSLKQKIVAGATAASLLVGGAFSPPGDLPENPHDRIIPPAAIEIVVPDIPDDGGDDDSVVLPEEEKKRRGARQRVFRAIPLIAGVWVAGIAIAAVCAGALTPILAKALGWIISVILLLFTYVAVAKTLFPELTLKQILNWKALLTVIVAATAVSLILKGLTLIKW